MTDPRITEIIARLEGATPGPWETAGASIEQVGGEYEVVVGMEEQGIGYMTHEVLAIKTVDANFIAAAPTDIAYLLERLATAEKQIARTEAAITLCVPYDLSPAGERVLRAALTVQDKETQ